ncbi:MAG: acyl-CoA desaturase, partial [Gammaproteobacteria bacterium]|nr:acyl-CoA desaturase [Gammaproteobacteria bacterium]
MSPNSSQATYRKITFDKDVGFYATLKKRVDERFPGIRTRGTGGWRMLPKTAIILTGFVVSYVFLVFFSPHVLTTVVAAFAHDPAPALIWSNAVSEGAHGSYSSNRTINWLAGSTASFIGASQMIWQHKHNVLHHTYTNVEEMDTDIQTGGMLRWSHLQEWRPWHRFQHLYAFPMYSLLTLNVIYSDIHRIISGRIGNYSLPKPSPSQHANFWLTKAFYVGIALVLPLFFNTWWHVLVVLLLINLVASVTLSLVFSLAHTVEVSAFPSPDPESGAMEKEWAVHEVETTANFAPRSKLAAWYLGGLNNQIEHHLFPNVCHLYYPRLRKIVEETCRDFSARYHS